MAGVRLGTRQMVLITALANATGVGTQYAMSHVIGFPLPFSLVIGTPSWASSMIALFLLSSGKRFQQSVAFRASMKNFVIVFLGQISLTLIYLTYIFGLVSVHHHLQSTFSGDTRIFTSAERLRFVQKCTHLLFTTEFSTLIEYTEVIIPVIYNLYVFAVLLKNHEFYPQLTHLEDPELGCMMSNIFIYVVLELMSLIMMTYVLKKKYRIDTTWQLRFVLERQWTMMHSKIFMWLFYIVQTSLVHFGADFSFQFVWLHTDFQGPPPTPLSL